MFDAYERVDLKQTLALATVVNGTVNGTAVDLFGSATSPDLYQDAVAFVKCGAWTDGAHTFTLEGAPDNGSGAPGAYAAVAAPNLRGANAVLVDVTGEGAQTYVIGFKMADGTSTRFLRVTRVTTGATTGMAGVEAHIVLAEPIRKLPVR